ncbi:MAG: Biotin operon repressor / Biotin-protein ligase [Labilithrix sp.]|nr:Biotin operon repressor / Biotin-protein ligase [Labilithrix sp.]
MPAEGGEGRGDLLRFPEVARRRGLVLGVPFALAAETGSTNDDAKAGARAGAAHGAVWAAERQTAGRGRQGRSWLAAPGESLLFSLLLRVSCPPARVPPLSLVCGLAVRDAVARALGPSRGGEVKVKWPNDVQVAGKKIAGILVESALSGHQVEHVIVGIGLNVHSRALPDEVATLATSLALASGDPSSLDRAELLADILESLARDLDVAAHRGLASVHARLAEHDALAGCEVESVEDGAALRGVAAGIDVDGRLLVRGEDGVIVRVSSGEMRLRVR